MKNHRGILFELDFGAGIRHNGRVEINLTENEVITLENHTSRQVRQTVQRKLILEILSGRDTPVTAEEIFELACRQKPGIALTTVYRNLETLLTLGILSKNIYNDGVARFEIAAEHRHYLICLKCKKTVPLPFCPFDRLEREISKETGFTIAAHKLEIFGYCPKCKGKDL